jgi:hypothetical protein
MHASEEGEKGEDDIDDGGEEEEEDGMWRW